MKNPENISVYVKCIKFGLVYVLQRAYTAKWGLARDRRLYYKAS